MPKDGRRIGKKVYYFDEAKLARADLESGASHIGWVFCHTLVQCEQVFGPSRK